MHKYLLRSVIIALSVTIMGCSTFMDDGRLSEGIIEYQVTYPKMDPSSVLAELLPTSMVLSFKNNQSSSVLSAGFGMFKMSVVNNSEDKEFSQLVKLINQKYVVKYDEESAKKSLKNFTEISIEYTGKTKMIAEYECQEAVITRYADSVESYTVYFTDQIHFDQSNWFTQYAGIEGVLLEYQVERYNLCSRFTAVKVEPQEVDEALFTIPEDYESIGEEEMNDKMLEIFNNFSE